MDNVSFLKNKTIILLSTIGSCFGRICCLASCSKRRTDKDSESQLPETELLIRRIDTLKQRRSRYNKILLVTYILSVAEFTALGDLLIDHKPILLLNVIYYGIMVITFGFFALMAAFQHRTTGELISCLERKAFQPLNQ